MKIIISPAKKMNQNSDLFEVKGMPVFLDQTKEIMNWMKQRTRAEAKELWKCNDKLTELNYLRFQEMDLEINLTPAVMAYEGLQYQYMNPTVMERQQLDYIQEHLRILSGFYGILRPFDGVVPYRMEMQTKAEIGGCKDLYDYWGDLIYQELTRENKIILNLASKEYSKAVEPYLSSKDRYITCVFGEMIDGKLVQKGTMAKMARGELVNYLAEIGAEEPDAAKNFTRMGFIFDESLSNESKFVFLHTGDKRELD